MKFRIERVKEVILREIGAAIQRELTFNAGLVTANSVDLTPDFKHCHVFIGVIGTDKERNDALGKLKQNRVLLQHEMSKRVVLKYTPQLHFHLDDSVERGVKVMEIMRKIDDQIGPVPPPEEVEGFGDLSAEQHPPGGYPQEPGE